MHTNTDTHIHMHVKKLFKNFFCNLETAEILTSRIEQHIIEIEFEYTFFFKIPSWLLCSNLIFAWLL